MAMVKKLASIGCTHEEIAAALDVCSLTLIRRPKFVEFFKKGQELMKVSLRRAQYTSAVTKGNVAMLIWMGKQYLGQRERTEISGQDGLIKIYAGIDVNKV